MLPEMNDLSRGDYILLQDVARSHTAKATLEYLNENCPVYVKLDHWPPIWGDFEKKVWKNKPHDAESIKQEIITEWRDYLQKKNRQCY